MTPSSPIRRALLVLAGVLALLLLVTAVDVLALVVRVERVDIPTVAGGAERGETWVIVGSDNRAMVTDGLEKYGTGSTRIGDHADVVIVIHRRGAQTDVFAVPRDLLVQTRQGTHNRLTLTLADSPDGFAAALCLSLGIPVDHLVIVRMGVFIDVVDILGGIDVEFPYDTQDPQAGLYAQAGVNHLTGEQALAYVRSRHPTYLIDGEWTAVDAAVGASVQRPKAAGEVLRLVAEKMRATRNPVTWQRLAWASSGGVAVDERTNLFDLAGLASWIEGEIPVLPVSEGSGDMIATLSDEAYDTLESAGYYQGTCGL